MASAVALDTLAKALDGRGVEIEEIARRKGNQGGPRPQAPSGPGAVPSSPPSLAPPPPPLPSSPHGLALASTPAPVASTRWATPSSPST